MTITPATLALVIIGSFVCGCAFFIQWLHVFADRSAPVVTGLVVARQAIHRLGFVPSVDFTIQVQDSGEEVHARTARYIMQRVPPIVRFRYSGDPTREVFLFEHEQSPFWIFLFFWGISLFLGFVIIWYRRSPQLREALRGGQTAD